MPRPTVLTDQVIDDLAEAIATGMPYEQACKRAGIAYSTFNNWENGRFPHGVSEHTQERFLEAVKRARAESAFQLLTVVWQHSREDRPGSWRAAAWLLERKFPQFFGRGPGRVSGPEAEAAQTGPTLRDLARILALARGEITIEDATI